MLASAAAAAVVVMQRRGRVVVAVVVVAVVVRVVGLVVVVVPDGRSGRGRHRVQRGDLLLLLLLLQRRHRDSSVRSVPRSSRADADASAVAASPVGGRVVGAGGGAPRVDGERRRRGLVKASGGLGKKS